MTVLKEYRGTGDLADPASWETIVVGAEGPEGPQGEPGVSAQWVALTQAEFDALSPKDPGTLYVIVP